MWPFNRKQKEADEIWRTLKDMPPEDAMEQLIESIASGNTEKAEDLFSQLIKEKLRQVGNEHTHKT